MKPVQYIYKDNIKFLQSITGLAYKALDEYCHLWFNLLKPINFTQHGNYEEEEVEGIQKKTLSFLSMLHDLCKSTQTKQFDMYKIGKGLGYDVSETEHIVENLSRSELIRHDKSSDKVAISPYGIMLINGEVAVGYAPIH